MVHVETIMKEIVKIQHKSKQFADMLAKGEKLSPSQLVLLVQLKISGGMKATEIAEFVGVTPGAVTAMCDKLEKAGLVERVRDSEDRRVVTMKLTSEGKAQVLHVFDKFEQKHVIEMIKVLQQVNELMSKILL